MGGKVALVTGASRGNGKAIALKLSSRGPRVVICDIVKEAAEGVASEIKGQGGDAFATEADVRDSQAVKAMMEEVTGRWDKIDILVNNAGINRDTLLLKMSDEAWDDVIDTNLRGTYTCTKFALRSMMRQRWGRIISMASIAGIIGNVGQTNYAASKAGIIAFTKSIAREVGSLNITANAIAPGFIVTEMTDKMPEDRREAVLQFISLRRYGKPEEVAELAAFLASDRASYISGQVIGIDGGMFA
ncbi:MAG: 3-oxoacyl-[acyl-carrier-protein] reductase [Dehalococcoidia bacterium]